MKAPPSFVWKTIVPLPPFALGNLSASSSCTWLVFVPGIEIAEEIVPENRLKVTPAIAMSTIQAMITVQCRRAAKRPRR
ncbi:hypothetical protein [Curtobacterium sp. MCJR17_043]|uniref:hypothetical protein n=1 Tax=Curtobacterium sp. MCJR17_043 TaxID=2175660 RepID=UPI0032E8F85C